MHKIRTPTLYLAFFIYVLFAFLMPPKGNGYDMGCWSDWAVYIFNHGLGNVYNTSCNYLPGHLFELKLYTLFFNSESEVTQNIYFLKYFTLLFDVIGALMVCSFFNNISEQKLILIVIMLNPASFHNSILWGQFDSVFMVFAFGSFLAINNKKFALGFVLYLISLNFKFQSIIFLPLLFLLLIYRIDFKNDWKKIIIGTICAVFVQFLFSLPFILESNLDQLLNTFKGLSSEYNPVALNAANIWHILLNNEGKVDGVLRWTFDWLTFNGIPLKKWGMWMYSTGLLIVLFPLMKAVYFKIRKKSVEVSFNSLLIMGALSGLCFFYFNTQMHERYSYPAFLFLASFAALTGRWWIYGLFSAAYFLNNEVCLQSIKVFNFNSWIFDLRFIAILFLSVILICILNLYSDKSLRIRFAA